MPLLFYLRDRFFVREVVRQSEGIDARRHAIFRRLVAQLDDLLNHLALRFGERAFLRSDLDQRLEFLAGASRHRAAAASA